MRPCQQQHRGDARTCGCSLPFRQCSDDAGKPLPASFAEHRRKLERMGSLMHKVEVREDNWLGDTLEVHVLEQLLALLPPGTLRDLRFAARAELVEATLQALPRIAPSLTALHIDGPGDERQLPLASELPCALLQLPKLRDVYLDVARLPDGVLPAVLALSALESLHLEVNTGVVPPCDQLTALRQLRRCWIDDYTHGDTEEPLLLPTPADFSSTLVYLGCYHNA